MPDLRKILSNDKAQANQRSHDSLLSPVGMKEKPSRVCTRQTDSEKIHAAKLRLASMNVGTMGYEGDGEPCSFKAHELLYDNAKLSNRNHEPRSTTLTNGPYTRLVSKGDNGQAGIELWIDHEALADIFECNF